MKSKAQRYTASTYVCNNRYKKNVPNNRKAKLKHTNIPKTLKIKHNAVAQEVRMIIRDSFFYKFRVYPYFEIFQNLNGIKVFGYELSTLL